MTASAAAYGSISRAAIAIEQLVELARAPARARSRCCMNVPAEDLAQPPLGARAPALAQRRRRLARGTARSSRPARARRRPSSRPCAAPAAATRPPATCSSDSIASIDAAVRSAPSRSALLTTKMSAISMMPALSACTSSPVPGTSVTIDDVGGADDVDFVLADADGLDDDDVEAGGVEDDRGLGRRPRQAAEMAARRHAADEHAGVFGVRLHAHAIAEDGAAAVRARRIDGEHADRPPGLARTRRSADRRACSCRRRAGRSRRSRYARPVCAIDLRRRASRPRALRFR